MARNSLKNICRLIDEATSQVPVEKSFLADLKRSIELDGTKNRRPPSQTYKPSSMHCIRNMYYQRIGEPQDEGESLYTSIGICNSGSDIHERMQRAVLGMHDNGIDCEFVNVSEFVKSRELTALEIVKPSDFENGIYETKLFHKDLNISFLCDGIIKYHSKYYIIEFKTESSGKWVSRKGVDPKHYMQATSYSLSFGIDGVIFVYISRDTLDMKTYLFTPTQEMIDDMTGKIITCDEHIARGETPSKPVDIPRSVCEWCAYRTACRRDG